MKPLAPNTLLQNRYLIVQLIGKGGMGEVYLAVDQRLGSAVALKRTLFSDDENLDNAFEREAKTLARLRHPVLPKVSDHFIENEMQYLVMEHIGGDDLAKRLEISKKPFPLEWVLFWTDQLLDALAYLHAHKPPIIHRDIKPQNLKLTSDNHVVLLDFGLAKNSFGNTLLTTTGRSIIGYTPHYAPMEQIRGGAGANPRSDIYSLSATVYQLLTDTVPADALTRADAVLSGLPDPVKSASEINPEVSVKISEIILKGMTLGSEHRYADARRMQEDLRAANAAMQNSPAQASALKIPSMESLPAEAVIHDFNAATNLDAPSRDEAANDAIKTNLVKNEIPSGAEKLSSSGAGIESSAGAANENKSSHSVQTGVPVSAGSQKKTGGKSLAAAAGIGGFAALALGAAAIGWYALKSPEKKPAPTVAAPSPRIEADIEPVKNANNDVNNSATANAPIGNANIGAGNFSIKTVSSPPANIEPAIKIAPPRGAATIAPRNSPFSPKKPATAKTPTRINRTDILQ